LQAGFALAAGRIASAAERGLFEKEVKMKGTSTTAHFAAALTLCAIFVPGAQAKSAKPAQQGEKQQQQGGQEAGGVPRYQPFPHNQTFLLKEINGKTSSVDMWLRIDTTGRGTGSSGCKNWSGVFIVGGNRLGPKAMPAFTAQKCDPAQEALERDFWGILLSGPYWDTEGSDLILKGAKGGAMRFTRSL
jgi:heat shock protein HslJ